MGITASLDRWVAGRSGSRLFGPALCLLLAVLVPLLPDLSFGGVLWQLIELIVFQVAVLIAVLIVFRIIWSGLEMIDRMVEGLAGVLQSSRWERKLRWSAFLLAS